MSGKKNFISIKRGLSQDAKHRERMGNRIWLFLHIIDRTDWDTGMVYDWRDKDEAEDMEMAWRTLQKQRQELEELGYISCEQKKGRQEITVHNWHSPRSYSGDAMNPKGTQKSVPLDVPEGTPEGTQHGTQHPYGDLGTPPLDSKVSYQKSQYGARKPRAPDPLFDAIVKVCRIDPTIKANGSSIGKVRSGLLGASPPYSAEEVIAWGKSQAWRKAPPTLWQLQAGIGAVRGTNGAHKTDALDEWAERNGVNANPR